MLRKLILFPIVFFLIGSAAVQAQYSISGKILDSQTGDPLPGANIFVIQEQRGASADAEGEYSIDNLSSGTYTIRLSFIGYNTITSDITVSDSDLERDFSLEPSQKTLDEVVVSGIAGTTSRAVSQTTVSKISAGELQEANNYSGISSLIGGKAAGVTVRPSSGNAGGSVSFNIRSGGGLGGDGQPVIYIDGTRVDNSEIEGFAAGGQGVGALSDLDPSQIEDIEILKGPAATAMYGTSGASGVVLITTKGQSGAITGSEMNIGVKSTAGINTKSNSYNEDDIINFEGANDVLEPNFFHENALNVSGGTDNVRYFTQLSLRDENGIGPNNSQRRQSFRGNVDMFPSEKLTVNVSTAFSFNDVERPQNDNNTLGVLGNLVLSPGGNPYFFTDSLAIFDGINNLTNTRRFTGNVGLSWTPIENLSISASIGLDLNDTRNEEFQSPNFDFGLPGNGGSKSIFNRNNEQWTYDLNATYNYNLGEEWQFTSVAGTQIFRQINTSNFIVKQDFPTGAIQNVGAGEEFIAGNENFFEAKEAGIFSQHDATFKDTYTLSVGGRLDWASAIGDETSAIFYPQGRVSVRLDQFDAPIVGLDAFQLFKIRAAYGETGELPGLFDGVDLLFGANAFAIGRGLTIEEIGNPDIEPERVKEFTTGFDIDFLNNYSASITFYRQWARQSIIGFQEAPSTGLTFDNPPLNVGGINSWGHETELSGTLIRSENVLFDVSLLYSFQRNRVVDLGGAQPIFDGFDVNVIKEGLPRSAFFVRNVDGAARDDNGNVVIGPGGLPVPNVSEGREFLGRPTAPHIGSVTMNLTLFKNLSLYQLWDWKKGLNVYNNTRSFAIQFANDPEFADAQEQFAAADPGSQQFRNAADKLANLDTGFDGNFIEDADFIKLREVTLSYDLTDFIAKNFKNVGIRNVSLSFSGRNLLTLTKYSGIDPEVNFDGSRSLSRGADFLTLQVPRQFFGSLNIGF